MNSISKGIFVFKNGLNGKAAKRKSSKLQIADTSFNFGKSARLWNTEFERIWETIRSKVDAFQASSNNDHLAELLEFVGKSYVSDDYMAVDVSGVAYLRVAALLTGINKPDHHQYFKSLADKMSSQNFSHTIFLPARDCPSVKNAIEALVSCILSDGRKHNYRDKEDERVRNHSSITEESCVLSDNMIYDVSDGDDEPPLKLRRNQYTLDVLQSWYHSKYSGYPTEMRPKLTIIVPNFEEFKPSVMKDLMLILSNHCNRLPFVVILGVATSTASILNTLSFVETTRIKLHAFSSQSPNTSLNRILDEIILTPKLPFQLASNVFSYLTGIFLFYDLTTKDFLKAFHYCLLEHYAQGNAYSLCAGTYAQAKANIEQLQHEDFEKIRRLPSFRPYVESLINCADIIAIFNDDEYFRNTVTTLIRDVYSYLLKFHAYLRVLWILVKNLPHAPLGKRLSDIYSRSYSGQSNIVESEDFAKCWQLLAFMSKQEFVALLQKCCDALRTFEANYCLANDFGVDKYIADDAKRSFAKTIAHLESSIERLMSVSKSNESSQRNQLVDHFSGQMCESRLSFRQKLFEMGQSKAEASEDIRIVLDFLKNETIAKYVPSYKHGPPLHELFVFTDYDSVRSHLRGTSRSAIHTALTNPQYYIQCNCCTIDNTSQLLATMPDISIAYKLVLECGQHVNIYDWLVAFNLVINGNRSAEDDGDDNDEIPAMTQAKFTRARAELQFLGFIKSSKRKTDHVTRTTW